MGMVEHNDDNIQEIIGGLNPNDGEYDKILDILDFPLESLGGDDKDWDASNSQDLGPIPLDAFMGFYPSNINNESPDKPPSCNHDALINIESEKKQQLDCVTISNNTVHRNGANTSRQNVISPDTSTSQTHSPISVLESSGTCSSGRSLPTMFEMVIPVRARSKRGRPLNVIPWFLRTPTARAASMAKRSSNSIEQKQMARTTELSNAPHRLKGSRRHFMKGLQGNLTHIEKKVTSKLRSLEVKRCTHCHVTKTPQWREGPLGKNTLCNACGVRFRSGRLFPEYRPAASPTFTPSLHSNSHRKVIEMRGKAIQETVLVENPMSSLAESVPMNSHLFDDSMFWKC